MEQVTHTSVFPVREELIIEFIDQDATGEVMVQTYQFEYDDDHPKTVRPKQKIPTRHESLDKRVLEEHEYELV